MGGKVRAFESVHQSLPTLGDLHKNFVADIIAHRVVYVLKIVKFHSDRDKILFALGKVVHQLDASESVGKAGKPVGHRLRQNSALVFVHSGMVYVNHCHGDDGQKV